MGSQKNENSNCAITTENKLTPVYGKIMLSLENCLLPVEKLEKSPSVSDGLDPETEYDLRIIGCELIQTAGILLRLPQVAMATGQVLFQRFYYCTSFVRHPMDVTAMGCVYLASKIEEAPRRVRDVMNVFHHIRQVRCQKYLLSDEPISPLILDENYINLKKEVIRAERRILKELGFCVHVKHPHKLIVMYLQVLTLQYNERLIQKAWNYMNDSLKTEVFLRYSPETVACACIYLSARVLKIPLPKNPSWFVVFHVKEEDIIDVCNRIVNLYKRNKIDPDELEVKVKLLRDKYKEEKEKREKIRTNNVVVSGNNTPNSNSSVVNQKSPSPPPSIKTTTNHVKKRSRSRGRSESPKKKAKKYSRKYDSPNERKRDISPTGKKYSTSPSSKKYASSPSSKKYASSPSSKKYASSPSSKKYASSPSSKKYANSPSSKKYASSPSSKKYASSPSSKKYASSPSSKKYASSPSSKKYASSPSSKKYATSPVNKKYNNSPLSKKYSPVSKKYASSPVSKKYASSRDASPIPSKKYDLSPIYSKKYYNSSPVSKLSSYYKEKDYRVKNHTYKKKRKD